MSSDVVPIPTDTSSPNSLERVSKIPPKRDPETGKIEERVVDGE